MITLNKYQPKILCYIRRRYNLHEWDGIKRYSLHISALWRQLDDALPSLEEQRKRGRCYSSCEVIAADMILFLLGFLLQCGCRDVEKLLMRRIEEKDLTDPKKIDDDEKV